MDGRYEDCLRLRAGCRVHRAFSKDLGGWDIYSGPGGVPDGGGLRTMLTSFRATMLCSPRAVRKRLQKDPNAVPRPITATSANRPPTIDTITMSK